MENQWGQHQQNVIRSLLSEEERWKKHWAQPDIAEDLLVASPTLKVYLVLIRITSAISLLASIGLFMETYADQQNASIVSTTTRILFLMAACEIVHNSVYVVGTTAADGLVEPNAWGAQGTTATCNLQGMIHVFVGIATFCWDICLCLTFVLTIRYNFPSRQLRRLETYMHAIVWPLSLALSVPPLFMKLYNSNRGMCFVIAVPENCQGTECIRGRQETERVFVGLMTVVFVTDVLVSIAAMTSIYLHARRLEGRNRRYLGLTLSRSISRSSVASLVPGSMRNLGPSSDVRSTRIAWQGVFFSGSIVVAHVPFNAIGWVAIATGYYSIHLDIVAAPIRTLYGLLFFLIFACERPDMRTAYGRCLRRILCGPYCRYGWRCCCCNMESSDDDRKQSHVNLECPSDAEHSVHLKEEHAITDPERPDARTEPGLDSTVDILAVPHSILFEATTISSDEEASTS